MAATIDRKVVVGVFESREQAQQAIHELKRSGFTEEQIGVAAKHDEDLPAGAEGSTYAGEGAGTGAVAGLGVGGLWGLGIVGGVLPAIGPAIAGGALASVLTSAAAGAAAGGIVGGLVGLGIPKEEAARYEEEIKLGRVLVTVRSDDRLDEAQAILQSFGAYDLESRGGTSARRPASAAGGVRSRSVATPTSTPHA